MSQWKQDLGLHGESLAAEHLSKHGYRILERRCRTPFGEIDLIAEKGRLLAFFEVKCRSEKSFGGPFAAINSHKRRHLKRAIQWYLAGDPRLRRRDLEVIAIGIAQKGEDWEILEEPIFLEREF